MTYNDTGQFIGQLCTLFTFHYTHIERLLLINFEQHPDDIYIGFEPQIIHRPKGETGVLVIGWRKDGKVDVYHQPQLLLQHEDYEIVGDGLSGFFPCVFGDVQFDIREHGVALCIKFIDREGRSIALNIQERNSKRRKSFGLLAPFPVDTQNLTSMPLPLLYDFYFVRRDRTDITIEIAGKNHQLDKLPLPIDGRQVYFARYSPDPFIVLFNKSYDGLLPIQPIEIDNNIIHGGAVYKIQFTDGNPEITAISTLESFHHQVNLTFTPAFPDVLHLQRGAVVRGSWQMDLEKTIGHITGTYHVQRIADRIEVQMIPTAGWHPQIGKLSIWFMFRVAPVFKNWPKNYRWHATIDLSHPDTPHLSSYWTNP